MKETLTSGRFWLWVVIYTALLAVIAAVLFPMFAQSKNGHGHMSTITRLKQLGTATYIYMSDYNERLPYANPFEFGIDPLAQYTKNLDIHRNYGIPKERSQFLQGGSDYTFQFVVEGIALDEKRAVRAILDVQKLGRPEDSTLIWTEFRQPDKYSVAYADTHVKFLPLPYRFESTFDPGGLLCLRGRLIGPKEQWPPPTWSLPIQDVLRYAESQKR